MRGDWVVFAACLGVVSTAGEAADKGLRYGSRRVQTAPGPGHAQALERTTVWRLDRTDRIGGLPVTVIGDPRVVDTEQGRAVTFDGVDDGLLVDANPLAGVPRFTIEVLFQPAAGGPEEQRFLHVEEAETGNRALIELRMRTDSQWALDTYLRSGPTGLTLLDRNIVHPAARWHAAALTYDGRTMTHYVNGKRELSGETVFGALGAGRTSIGVRQNRVSWFKGVIHTVRFTPEVLPPSKMLSAPAGAPLRDRDVITLWPEGVPGARPNAGDERLVDGRIYNVQSPSLVYVAPRTKPSGTAVVICPGGSYARLAMANEAEGVAARLSHAGVASFILKYRLAEYGQPAPLQDVLRAVRLLRNRVSEFGLSPERIGVMGASAGGHLAASAATLFDAADGRTGHPLDAVSGRPDFVALLYPVVTMTAPFAHLESKRNLIGAHATGDLVARWSIEQQVRRDMPPLFIVHTAEDRSVPVENSLLLYGAARRAGVRAELHLYDRGPHGFGTRTDVGPASGWVDRWLEWLEATGFIPPLPRN